MITADTITDEQIRTLYDDGVIDFDMLYHAVYRVRLVGESAFAYKRSRNSRRARCAEIFNARAAADTITVEAVTADTITDEQLHVLWCDAVDAGDTHRMKICKRALGDRVRGLELSRTKCRVLCAKIFNARAVVSK